MWNIYEANLNSAKEKRDISEFLNHYRLIYEQKVDYTLILKEKNEIKATASKYRNIFKCFAIEESLRGEGILPSLISKLMDQSFHEGYWESYIYTKPMNKYSFEKVGYQVVCETDDIVLLENGLYGFNYFVKDIKKRVEGSLQKNMIIGLQKNIHKYYELSNAELIFIYGDRDKEYIIPFSDFPTYFIVNKEERLKVYQKFILKLIGEIFEEFLSLHNIYIDYEFFDYSCLNENKQLKKLFF